MVSVARWLDTFTCSKYADRFEQLGYSTLQSICQLTSTHLQNLGISSADIYTIMENILLLRQSINSLNSPRCLDLNSEPPLSSTISFSTQVNNVSTPLIVNDRLPSTQRTSYNDFLPQQPLPSGMMYRGSIYNIHPPRFHSPEQQQQFMHPNQRMMPYSPWNNHQPFPKALSQQFSHLNMTNQQQQSTENLSVPSTNESYSHPLQSLERLVLLPESQVIDPKSIVNENSSSLSPFSEALSFVSTTPIVSNLLSNEKSTLEHNTTGLKRCSINDERNELNKKSRMNTNTEDSIINNHPVVTSLLTRSVNNSIPQTPLPSITSLQQKYNV